MLVKMFWFICAAVALAAALVFVTGNFTMFSAVVFGFIAFGLIFMGMISVLPVAVSHPTAPKEKVAKPVEIRTGNAKTATAFGSWKSA